MVASATCNVSAMQNYGLGRAHYRINGGKDANGPPIILKIGGWFHSKASANQFFANDRLTVVSPAAAGSSIARENFSGYAVVDAMLLPGPGRKGGLAAFAGIAGLPRRRKISVELTGGLVYDGPFGRDSDKVGFGVSAIRVGQPLGSHGALASQYAFHGHETVLELSYQVQVRPSLQVQPDFHYIITPGGGRAIRTGRASRSAASPYSACVRPSILNILVPALIGANPYRYPSPQ